MIMTKEFEIYSKISAMVNPDLNIKNVDLLKISKMSKKDLESNLEKSRIWAVNSNMVANELETAFTEVEKTSVSLITLGIVAKTLGKERDKMKREYEKNNWLVSIYKMALKCYESGDK